VNSLLTSLIVPALLIAVNPVPIAAVVTLLATAHGKRSAGAFVATLVVIMLAVGLLTIFLLGQPGSSGQKDKGTGLALVQTAIGVVFLVMCFLQWRNKEPASEAPKWMQMMDKAGFSVAVVLGLSLTNYALLSAGTSKILKSGVGSSSEVTALLFFIILALSTVIVPVVLYLVFPRWAALRLGGLKSWLATHNRVLLIIVFGAMGVLFSAQGLSSLLH
jgi:Sap, sulfolipid-1-addressing protein